MSLGSHKMRCEHKKTAISSCYLCFKKSILFITYFSITPFVQGCHLYPQRGWWMSPIVKIKKNTIRKKSHKIN